MVEGNICYFDCHEHFLDCLANSDLWKSQQVFFIVGVLGAIVILFVIDRLDSIARRKMNELEEL